MSAKVGSYDEPQEKTLEELEREEEEALSKKDDEFMQKWSGFAILGPFIPAQFSLLTAVGGGIILQTRTGDCNVPLHNFLEFAVVVGYFFLLVFSWVFFGDKIVLHIPVFDSDILIATPFRSLRMLLVYYSVLAILASIAWLVGVILMYGSNLGMLSTDSRFCADRDPQVYYFSEFLIWSYFTGVLVVLMVLINMKFGGELMELGRAFLKEATPEELEEKIFRKKFAQYDKDKLGYITKDELPDMLQELGVYIPDEEMPDLVTQLDPQLEGKIQFDRLLPWFKEMNALTADTPAYMEEDADEGKK